ncbi:MAG TPA: hypothetical protein VHG08_19020 [Longimicrobium sp.]|nr:hypothetical protein [Longimicrobium sp.]
MKKLTLNLDTLQVETFTTAKAVAARGTVRGHYGTTHTQAATCDDPTCEFRFTCAADCTEFSCGGPEPTVCW